MNNQEYESSDEDEDEESSSDDDNGSAGIRRPAAGIAALPEEMTGLNLKLGNTEPVEEDVSRANKKSMKKAQAKKEIIQEESEDSDSEDDDDLLNPEKATAKRQEDKAKGKTATAKPVVPEMSRKEK